MRPNQQSENEDQQLNSVLRQWVVEAPLPPGFREQVWNRIAKWNAPAPVPGFWDAISGWVEAAFPRPKVALSYIAGVLVLAVTAGSLAAQAKTSQLNATLSERYVQTLDPYRAELPQP